MLFAKKERRYYQLQAPLTSLIDIVFLLLVYFLLTTNFMVDEGINIKLPKADASAPQTSRELTIFVDKDGGTFFDGKPVVLNALLNVLKQHIAGQPDRLVVIKADRAVVLDKAVKVMDIAKAAGAARLALATEKDF